MLNHKILKYSEKIAQLLILLFCALFIIKCISIALTSTFSFDGAIISQVAKNLADKLKFKTDYWNEEFYVPAIGATVIFPVAIFFKLFGKSFASGLMVNAIYMILLFLFVIYYLKYCIKLNNFFILLWIIIFYSTNKLFEYGYGLYGEFPMIFYFIAGVIFLYRYFTSRKTIEIFLAGLFLGLGFLTKFIFLIIIPAFLLTMAADFFINTKVKIKKIATDYFIWLFAFVLPNLLFEMYKLANVGIKNFFFHWGWFLYAAGVQGGTVKQQTERIKDAPDLFIKFVKHTDLLSQYTGVDKIILIFLLLAGMFLFYLILSYMIKKINKKELKHIITLDFLFLTSVTLTYFIWWIFISPTDRAWHRRIMPGIILYEICFVVLLFLIYEFYIKKRIKNKKFIKTFSLSASIFLICLSGYYLIAGENIRISFNDTEEKRQIMQVARYMTTFPSDSEFFGFKWWQAPVISFASGKVFKDFFLSEEMKTAGDKQNKYLVLDRPALENQKLCIEKLLSDFEFELLYVLDEVRIYKLVKRVKEREYVEECN